METSKLKRFAQYARTSLMEQVAVKMEFVLASESAARRENKKSVEELEKQIAATSKEQVIDKVAYTWFNRFCALRFMDVNRYTRISVISPLEGQFQPEILAEAKMGHIDDEVVPEKVKQNVFALLNGSAPSSDPQAECYRLLIVAVCNYYHKPMPFLFEKIEDYTELLMPDDLLSGNSILAYTREAMTPDACSDVEVIGWLYQFYISEKKDEVFEGLKKNQKITPENIPAATQLFTPNWIVRYLVENSLGRLWMLNRPKSKLIDQMDYYIKPEQPETDFLRINTPEEIRFCDPASGSGHMLVYGFDLLYAIYEEEGYDPATIVELILTKNLYGIEIDSRAGVLAAFALTMKALQYDKRFLRRSAGKAKIVEPNICVLQNVKFEDRELSEYMDFIGRDLFTANLETALGQFEHADNFGSLIRPAVTDVAQILEILKAKNPEGNLFLFVTHQKVMQALKQIDYLSPKYHVVVANPPYMGGKGMNGRLIEWVKKNYPDSKSDLFSMFIERNLDLVVQRGAVGMITMQSWMFLYSYEKLREKLLTERCILSMAHLGARGFDSIGGEVVQTTAFVLGNEQKPQVKSYYLRLVDGENEEEKQIDCKENRSGGRLLFRASAEDFRKIPGSPIAYWVSEKIYNSFNNKRIGDYLEVIAGLTTGNTDKFLRYWQEVNFHDISYDTIGIPEQNTYVPYDKGGAFRKWYGNLEYVLFFSKRSILEMEKQKGHRPDGISHFFQESLTWAKVASSDFSTRFSSKQNAFDATSSSAFGNRIDLEKAALILNSKLGTYFLNVLNSTMVYLPRDVKNMPISHSLMNSEFKFRECFLTLLCSSKTDWDSFETSWDFTELPLLSNEYRVTSNETGKNSNKYRVMSNEREDASEQTIIARYSLLATSYSSLRANWLQMTLEMQQLEEENNRIFIDAYGLQDELTPEVPLKEITLTCNPYYRYGGNRTDEELEALLLADTMKEYISYSVGCMFGRYALEKPGLILANQGETYEDYLKHIPEPSFPADEDNVIPILDGAWFSDDMAERFKKFLKITFGTEHYSENLNFIEMALGKNGKPISVRDYFVKEFYNDHIRRYKKRPIYWMFSSLKGNFNALIYMHRYRADTVSVILNGYLREYRTKLTSHINQLESVSISGSSTPAEKTRALKEIDKTKKVIDEIDCYEREILYPLATKNIEIDLDDGVKVNYQKFGKALRKIPGLEGGEE